MFTPITSHEILIMGEGKISIFDTKNNVIDQVSTDDADFIVKKGILNQCFMSREGQVVALVIQQKYLEYAIVSFTKGDQEVQMIENLGYHRD